MKALIHNNPKDLVTVVIAMYNGEKTIVLTINSIFEQTHKDINILICDDGSTDSSIKLDASSVPPACLGII